MKPGGAFSGVVVKKISSGMLAMSMPRPWRRFLQENVAGLTKNAVATRLKCGLMLKKSAAKSLSPVREVIGSIKNKTFSDRIPLPKTSVTGR